MCFGLEKDLHHSELLLAAESYLNTIMLLDLTAAFIGSVIAFPNLLS